MGNTSDLYIEMAARATRGRDAASGVRTLRDRHERLPMFLDMDP